MLFKYNFHVHFTDLTKTSKISNKNKMLCSFKDKQTSHNTNLRQPCNPEKNLNTIKNTYFLKINKFNLYLLFLN